MSKKKILATCLFAVGVAGGLGMIITDYFIYAPVLLTVMWVPAMWIWMTSD